IVAKTVKGQGVSFIAGKLGWHGRALKKGEELDHALSELKSQLQPEDEPLPRPQPPGHVVRPAPARGSLGSLPYTPGESVATREAYGFAIARLGASDDRIVALDADVGNSTFSDKFEKQFPDRFYENYIAEQAMIGAAMGLAARGAIPF